MKTKDVKTIIKKHGLTWDQFLDFMFASAHGINEDGSANWYTHDVQDFINNKPR